MKHIYMMINCFSSNLGLRRRKKVIHIYPWSEVIFAPYPVDYGVGMYTVIHRVSYNFIYLFFSYSLLCM